MNKKLMMIGLAFLASISAFAVDLKVGEKAPLFELKNQNQASFALSSRKGHWTVLYFYPKAETPGCTKQACAFRDKLAKFRAVDAVVYGISVNSDSEQAKFHKNHSLNFDLLADANGQVTKLYGSKMPIVNMSKRWTFIIDPELVIRSIDKDVDPVKDGDKVLEKLAELQKK
jgi:peroxiredoxin Q/BCP